MFATPLDKVYISYKFSPNLLNGLICEATTRAKQSLLSDREIPGNRHRQDLETKI